MKRRRLILISGWSLVFITSAAGLGVTHLYETRFTASGHLVIGALSQLVSLTGLCLLALFMNDEKPAERHPPGPHASS